MPTSGERQWLWLHHQSEADQKTLNCKLQNELRNNHSVDTPRGLLNTAKVYVHNCTLASPMYILLGKFALWPSFFLI